jgi:hypothetical protein
MDKNDGRVTMKTMLKDYRLQSFLGIWGGVFFFALGVMISGATHAMYRVFSMMLEAGGYILFVSGCVMYAKGKGHRWYLGLLGILGPLGLLFLYVLKDKSGWASKKRAPKDF